MTRVLEQSKAKGITRLVLVVIANYEGDKGAWPSIDTIARDANASVRAVFNAVERAQVLGELEVHSKGSPAGTNLYRTFPGREVQNLHSADSVPLSAPEPKELTSSSKKSRSPAKTRKPDPVFDALAVLHGGRESLTRSMAQTVGVATAAIREASPDVTPEEIDRRARAYRDLEWNFDHRWPSAQSLAKWWPECVEKPVSEGTAPTRLQHIYAEGVECACGVVHGEFRWPAL